MTNNGKKIACVALASALCLGVGFSAVLPPLTASAESYASGAFVHSTFSDMEYSFRSSAVSVPNAVASSVIVTGNLGWFYSPIIDRYPEEFWGYLNDSYQDGTDGYPLLSKYGTYTSDSYDGDELASKSIELYRLDSADGSEINSCSLTLAGLRAIPTTHFRNFQFTAYDAGISVVISCSVFDYNSRVWRDIRQVFNPTSTDQITTVFLAEIGNDLAPYAYTERQTSVFMVRDLLVNITFNPTTSTRISFDYTPGDYDMPLGYTDTADSAFSALTDRITEYVELSPIETIIASVTAFFETEFVPGFSVGDLLLIALGTMIFGAFLKIFLGG